MVKNRLLIRFGLPIALLLTYTLVSWVYDFDLRVAHLAYIENEQWPGVNNFPWNFLYDYAAYPAFLMAGTSLIILVLGLFVRSASRYRRQSLFLVLLLILGPGLVVNVMLKDTQGRARPREIIEFGGKHQFSQIWQKGDTGKNSSFPSGHASAGFYLMAPWFLLRRNNRAIAAGCLLLGIAYGSFVGTARIMQGGHFLSDVVWAGGFVYLTGEILALALKPEDWDMSGK